MGATINLQLANLSEVEADLVQTLTAVLCDPKLADARARLVAGSLALTVDGGEVTWINPQEQELAG